VSKAWILGLAAVPAIPLGATAGRAASTPPPIVFAADRAPSLSGEIYRVDPNGHRVDLSRSPYQDTNPVVSSDGKRVAFISDRGGMTGIYEVGVDGRGLVAVARTVRGLEPHTPDLAWQPHGRSLAVRFPATHRVGILRPGRKPIFVRGGWGYGSWQPWSLDGRVLLVSAGHELRAVTPQGRPLWHVPVAAPSGTWSPQGLFAVSENHGAAVYDEQGRLRFKLRFDPSLTNAGPTWSPDGRNLLLSSASGFDFQVSTNAGAVLLRKHLRYAALGWAGNDRLVIGYAGRCGCYAEYMNVHTGRLSPGSSRWFDPLSADGKLAIVTPRSGSSFSLDVAAPEGGAPKRYAHVPGCWDDGVWEPALDSPQFVGSTRSVVYASLCYEPFSYVYSITPDGTGLHEIAGIKPYATQPVLSPDASQVAYSWAKFTGFSCGGCASEIRVASSDGTNTRVLANPSMDCAFDLSPTWSPDGQTLLFTQETCNTPGELFTVPSAGGQAHDLGIAGTDPAWGPSRIAYVGSSDSDTGLWTANPDGSDPMQVAKKGTDPAWATDGRLAYLLNPATVVVGSTQVKLPFTSISSLAWSPDGTRFIVTARTKGSPAPDLYTVRTDRTDPMRLTKNYDASGVSWR
jgi:Tol biopolymer transport system component